MRTVSSYFETWRRIGSRVNRGGVTRVTITSGEASPRWAVVHGGP